MQLLEVSGAVRPIYGSLGVKRLKLLFYANGIMNERLWDMYVLLALTCFMMSLDRAPACMSQG